jgi:DNA invertase Pin-like site-specific DNA recombinase
VFYLMVAAEDIKMLSTNNNDYNYTERKRIILDLYNQGKSTRYIAKELRMSLRDISIILRKNQVNHGIVITNNGNGNSNNKSPNEKATQACRLFSEFPSSWHSYDEKC